MQVGAAPMSRSNSCAPLEKKFKNWNAKRVAFITEKEIREEYKEPTFDLVSRTRKRRLNWAKDLLQADSQLRDKI
jgi:hypothetical protein